MPTARIIKAVAVLANGSLRVPMGTTPAPRAGLNVSRLTAAPNWLGRRTFLRRASTFAGDPRGLRRGDYDAVVAFTCCKKNRTIWRDASGPEGSV